MVSDGDRLTGSRPCLASSEGRPLGAELSGAGSSVTTMASASSSGRETLTTTHARPSSSTVKVAACPGAVARRRNQS